MRVSVQQKIIKRKGYRVIIIGILLFQCIVVSVDGDPSQGRWGHTSILINNRLYVYGGATGTLDILNELIYLNVLEPFGTESPPWVPSEGGPSPLAFHSCSFGGSQKELLIFFGGNSTVDQVNSLFTYNTTEETWSPDPSITGTPPSKRGSHTMVTRESDSIAYLWGGTPIGDGGQVTALNDLYRLTTDTLSWDPLSPSPLDPAGRWDHSATLLNDGKMYIIGGMTAEGILASMSEIPIYDTNEGTWTIGTAVGQIIRQRRLHRAVGTTDNRIIVYGGTTAGFDEKLADTAVLSVTDTGLTWTQPTVIGSTPPGRYAHSMTLIGSKAVVAYGSVDDDAGRKLFIFDVDTFTWEPTYNPTTNTTAPTDPTDTSISSGNKSNSKLGIIVGVPVAGVVIVLALVGLLFFWFRRRKKKTSFSAIPYEKQQASIPPISGPAPAPLNNYGSSSDDVDGAPFIPPFATSNYERRQPSFGSINETRNLTPVDQHDSWGSAPSNSSQSQLPQINPGVPLYETISKTASPISNVPYLSSPTFFSQQHSNTPPTPPPSTPTPPPVSPQKDFFPISTAAGASSSTKTSSTNLRLDSDSNTAPIEFDYNPPPVAPLLINRTRTPPSQAQTQQLTTPPRLPISTSSSSSSLPKDSTNALVSSPTEMEATTTSTEDEGETNGSFNSPLFRTEALSSYAGTVAAASPADRSLSLRSVPRLNTQSTPRGSIGLSSPSSVSAGGRLRSGTLEGQRTYDGNVTGGSRPTSPINNDASDNQPPRTRLFGADPEPSDDGY